MTFSIHKKILLGLLILSCFTSCGSKKNTNSSITSAGVELVSVSEESQIQVSSLEELLGNETITFSSKLESSEDLNASIDSDNSKNYKIEDNKLVLSENNDSGEFSLTFDYNIKKIKLNLAKVFTGEIKIGIVNPYGIKAVYANDVNGDSVEFTYADYLITNHILISTSQEISINSIEVTYIN